MVSIMISFNSTRILLKFATHIFIKFSEEEKHALSSSRLKLIEDYRQLAFLSELVFDSEFQKLSDCDGCQ